MGGADVCECFPEFCLRGFLLVVVVVGLLRWLLVPICIICALPFGPSLLQRGGARMARQAWKNPLDDWIKEAVGTSHAHVHRSVVEIDEGEHDEFYSVQVLQRSSEFLPVFIHMLEGGDRVFCRKFLSLLNGLHNKELNGCTGHCRSTHLVSNKLIVAEKRTYLQIFHQIRIFRSTPGQLHCLLKVDLHHTQ